VWSKAICYGSEKIGIDHELDILRGGESCKEENDEIYDHYHK